MNPASPPRRKRPVTEDELLDRFAASLQTTALHCQRFKANVDSVLSGFDESNATPPKFDIGPISELAAQLRRLLSPRKGDHLLKRACSGAGTPEPTVPLAAEASAPNPTWDKEVVESFSVGAIPGGTSDDLLTPVSEVWNRVCVVLKEPDEDSETFTWGKLILDVSDQDGVHVDNRRPVVWDYMNAHHFGDVPTIPLMLYRLSVAVIEAGNDVLIAVGREPVELETGHALGGVTIFATSFTRSRPRPGPRPKRNDPCPCGSGMKFKRCCD